ncbi:heavy metal translocating P-type ATPase [Enterococcus timonensis]|uniref:heavy metal translocating P-type ATPase n=1 Tax=Enterococcus timonensis TaxID=1852364 RepID=UPI0008DAC841|nr:heavy metal translocating P-type ATPase [Enterococcus timonensis]
MNYSFHLKGLDCASCAEKIERAVEKMPDVTNVSVNFAQSSIQFATSPEKLIAVEEKITQVEPDVTLINKNAATKSSSAANSTSTDEKSATSPLIKIIGIFLALVIMHFIALPKIVTIVLYAILYLVIGWPVLAKAFSNLRRGQVFDENFLMSIATLGAFSIQEFPEAVAVMLFYELGEYFQDLAVDNSRKSIQAALQLRPEIAHLQNNGQLSDVKPENILVGQQLKVLPGEKIPLDGKIIAAGALIDTAPLTGESVPRFFQAGDEVLAGMVNTNAPFSMEVTKDDQHSTASKILELVENATSQKAPAEKFITKFARIYTPIVVAFAAILGIVPPLFFAQPWSEWIYRALTFLVISCPCALVISVPLSFFAGIGAASKNGVLIKGSHFLENLAQTKTILFDKTGTLTKGNFALTKIVSSEPEKLLQLAASLEVHSTHPVGKVLVAENKAPLLPMTEVEEKIGFGLTANYQGTEILVGKQALLTDRKIETPTVDQTGTIIFVAQDNIYQGYFVIQDEIKPEANAALSELKKMGIKKIILLTGDTQQVAESIQKQVPLDEIHSQLLPQDKVAVLEETLAKSDTSVAFVGDGLNDAPVLARADVGISMGGLGSDAAIEASDVVLMEDQLTRLPVAIQIAQKTMRIVKENIIFALVVKFIVLILGAFGIVSMGLAVFADVGVTLIAVLNALRALKK